MTTGQAAQPRVSVVIPCYNAARWIRETLESVYAQDMPCEIIVVDDGSTDESAAIVAREFPDVIVHRTPNGGPSRARNAGTALATAEFIQYLDADDLLAPGKLATQLALLESTGADVAYGAWLRIIEGDDGEWAPTERVARQIGDDPELALFTDFWCPLAAYLFRGSIVARVGGWNEQLPVIQDARFALDCAWQGARFIYAPEVAAHYRVHGDGSVSTRSEIAFNKDIFTNTSAIEARWVEEGTLVGARRQAVADSYAYVAQVSRGNDHALFEASCAALARVAPGYLPDRKSFVGRAARLLGFRRAHRLAALLSGLRERIRSRAAQGERAA